MSSRWPAGVISKNPVVPAGPAQNNAAPGMWRMDEVAYWRKQGLWPTAGIIPDPYFNYVSLLLSTTSAIAATNNAMVDSSALTSGAPKYNNATQGTFSPYDPSWSNYFDGTGDYLTVPNNTAFDQNTAFTVEMWVYPTATSTDDYLYSQATNNFFQIATNSSGFVIIDKSAVGAAVTSSAALAVNTWTHIAMVSNGSTIVLYINGVSQGSTSVGTTATSASTVRIGAYQGTGALAFPGYISNARVVKGTAVYTAAFTPPTKNLTAISGTSLLTCASNRFQDLSLNNFTITRNGDTRVISFSPFAAIYPGVSSTYAQSAINYWSGFFDGGGDNLTTATSSGIGLGTADFTYECWIYPISYPNDSYLITNASSSTGNTVSLEIRNSQVAAHLFVSGSHSDVQFTDLSPPLRMWSHIAISRVSGVLYGFLNGVRSATTQALTANFGTSAAANITTSAYTGYLSDVRMTKNVAVYSTATYTIPTAPLTANANTAFLTCQSSTFVDNSPNNLPIIVAGNTTPTGNNPFNTTGYWSLGGSTGDGATIAQTTATDLGSGNFTVEFWVNVSGYTGGAFVTKRRTDTGLTGSWGFFVTSDGYVTFQGVGWASTYTSNTVLPIGQWNHIAVSRSGTTLSMFMNGVRVATTTDSYNYTCSTYTIIKLGGNSGGNYPSGSALTSGVYGYVSNLRIVQGTAVYNPASTSITVPTSPLTAVSGTSLLTLQDRTFKDNSTNNLTVNRYGSASSPAFNPFSAYSTVGTNGGSMYFDGSSDYIAARMDTDAVSNVLSGDFTIECWVYPLGSNNDQGYISAYGGWALCMDNSGLRFSYGDTIIFSNSTRPTLGMWSHLAVCRSGSSLRVFLNGTQLGSTVTNTTAFTSNSANTFIGSLGAPGWFFTGYITDARVSWGALYISSFIPPTAPLTPTQNTRILLNGMNAGAFDATAINNIETGGNARVLFPSPFAPANYWAAYFDGTGDYLTQSSVALGSGSFTAEMWVYLTSLPNAQNALFSCGTSDGSTNCIWYLDSSGTLYLYSSGNIAATSTTVPLNQWVHLAVVRNGTSVTNYINGVARGTGTTSRDFSSTPFQVFRGYGGITASPIGSASNLRVTNTAVYTADFTPSTTPLTAISGTSFLTLQNKTFVDNSPNAYAITAFGNATAGAIGPFTATGGTSVYFDGSGDYLSSAANPAFNFGAGDFTVECWLYRNTNVGTGLFESRGGGTGFLWYIDGTNQFARVYIQATAAHPTSTVTVPTNQWVHLALTRSSGTIYFWMNGQAAGSAAITTSLNDVSPLRFAASNDGAAFDGYMSNMRVTNGYARYTSSYTPPTQAFLTY